MISKPPVRFRSLDKRSKVNVPWPSLQWLITKVSRFAAFGMGVGLIRPASGTWGTLLAWLLWAVLHGLVQSDFLMGLFLIVVFIYGCMACESCCRELKIEDHGGIVLDEIVAFWMVLFILNTSSFLLQLVAFALFRFFDIIKPVPIRYLDEKFKNGFGVMFDDTVAGFYTLLVISLLIAIIG